MINWYLRIVITNRDIVRNGLIFTVQNYSASEWILTSKSKYQTNTSGIVSFYQSYFKKLCFPGNDRFLGTMAYSNILSGLTIIFFDQNFYVLEISCKEFKHFSIFWQIIPFMMHEDATNKYYVVTGFIYAFRFYRRIEKISMVNIQRVDAK